MPTTQITETDSTLATPERNTSAYILCKTHARLLTYELVINKLVLFKVSKFVVICFSNNRKLVK